MMFNLKKNKILRALYLKAFGEYKPGHWCRVVMNKSTHDLIAKLDYKNMSVLEISGTKWKNFGFAKYKSVQYPEFDISQQVLDEQFDLIIAEQVFEHIHKPYRAGVNVFKMLKPGSHFLITTPFMIRIHPHPDDCTRWSKTGIKYFLEDCGFALNNIESYSWGNRSCVKGNFRKWVSYIPFWHSLKNEEFFPLVIWAIATK